MRFLLGIPVVLASLALLALGLIAHPFAPFWPATLVAIWLVVLFALPRWWIAIYLALIPGLDLAPFSGWFFFEDFDFLTLCVLLVGYGRWMARPFDGKLLKFGVALLICYALTLGLSALIGLLPLAPFDANAFSHYFSRYNALRLLKGPLVAMLLLPIVLREFRLHPEQAARAIVAGMCAGLGIAGLSVLWERAAFLDLTNLSADYRATGFFAATHTGGAALDGYLALTLPFAVLLVLGANHLRNVAAGGALTAAGLYSVIMTFSRALYGTIAVSVVMQIVLSLFTARKSGESSRRSAWFALPFIALGMYYLLQHVFASSGYRGFATGAGFFASLFLLTLTPFKLGVQGVFALIAIVFMSAGLPFVSGKGVYLVYGLCLLIFAASYAAGMPARARYGWASALGLAINSVAVASHWGNQNAFFDATLAVACGVVVATANALSRQRLWTLSRTSMSLLPLGLAGIAVTVVAMNSFYAGSRFSTTQSDWETRKHHWNDVYNAMEPGALHFALGTGLGRMPETYFWRNSGAEIPGTFVFAQDGANQFLRLSGSRYGLGYGDPLRILQAVRVSSPGVVVELDARTKAEANLFVGICARHLIYSAGCAEKAIALKASPAWTKQKFELDLRGLQARQQWVPRPYFLVIYTDTQKSLVDIDNVNIQGTYGSERIRNGEFTYGLDHWYFSSDRFHLAWHAKNTFLHVMFEQGVIGLAFFCLLLAAAFSRLLGPVFRGHRGAIALALSLVGFIIIGMFDSLIDVPRLSLIFYVLLFSAVAISPKILFAEQDPAKENY